VGLSPGRVTAINDAYQYLSGIYYLSTIQVPMTVTLQMAFEQVP
jgi:hypothetical protein